jgi:hypothetical protein
MPDQDQPNLRKIPRWLKVVVVLFVVGVVGFFWLRPDQTRSRRALPFNASDIHEYYKDFGFLPDYVYHLKAKISADQFQSYVDSLGLTPHTPTRVYTDDKAWLSWSSMSSDVGAWWNPTDSLDGTFVDQQGDGWTFAKYENGYLYLTSQDH